MSNSDRWATILYVLALALLLAVGGLEYYQYEERTKVEDLVRKEKDLQTKVNTLKTRAAAAEKQKPLIAANESQLMKLEKGNFYGQLLLDAVGNKRQTGVQFPQYSFVEAGTAGKFPRYNITGVATGSEEQVLAYIRSFEEGPYKVQIPTITYQISPASVTANLTLTYTMDKPMETK